MGKNYPKIIPLSQYVGKNGGLVNADKLLAAIEGEEAGTAVTFPNIYLGIGEENAVKEDPARYFVNGESLSYTLKIDNTSVATGEIKEGKAVFIGLKEGGGNDCLDRSQRHGTEIQHHRPQDGQR